MAEAEELAIEVYLEARRNGAGPIVAARMVNSTAEDIERYARLNESFATAVRDAVEESLERIEMRVKDSAQSGDMTAAKMVLESHLPERWSKPEKEMLLRLGQPVEIDVAELHSRLKELAAGDVIDVEEVETDESTLSTEDSCVRCGRIGMHTCKGPE
jgi:hypothetical protein